MNKLFNCRAHNYNLIYSYSYSIMFKIYIELIFFSILITLSIKMNSIVFRITFLFIRFNKEMIEHIEKRVDSVRQQNRLDNRFVYGTK
jgi:hypothetical protein